jgi:chitodextrinase
MQQFKTLRLRLRASACGAIALFSVLPVSAAAQTSPPTSGLLGYWNFDEDTGIVADDSSGNGYNGTVNGATWVTGYINYALKFNGTTNDVVTPNIPLQNAFSISVWVNPALTPQTPFGRIAETEYNHGFYLGLSASGSAYQFIVNGGAGATGTCDSAYGCTLGGTVTSGWHLVTATYNGTNAILYVDGMQVATETFTAPANESLPLYIGRYYAGNGYGWNGAIDEVRLYSRALSSAEVSAIYNYTAGPPDTTPPTVPTDVSATAVSPTSITVTWTASTDNVGVAGYKVFRNGTQVGTSPTNSYTNTGLTASTEYSYTVAAYDVAGNVSAQSSPAATATTLPPDTTPPTVSMTAPVSNSTVSGTVTVSATATDSVGVANVQFQVNGANLGSAQTISPYSVNWTTTSIANGSYTLTAIATDNYGNTATSSPVTVTVNNAVLPPPTTGLLGYWPFNEDSGSVADDVSGNGNKGTITGATWVSGYIGSALNFNGTTNAVATGAIPLGATFTISAWVNASATRQTAFGRIAETEYNTGLYLGVNAAGTSFKFIVNDSQGSTGTCGASYGCAEGGTVSSGWHLITGTYDGATARLYVDQSQVASDTFTPPESQSLPFHIGVSSEGSGSGWNGVIDEVRLYNLTLSAAQIDSIYDYTGGPADTTPPTVPGNLTAVGISTSAINLTWTASTDPVGVAGYQVFRNGTMVGTTSNLSYQDTGLATSTTYAYSVTAYDTMGNISAPSSVQTGTTQAPTISNILPVFISPTGATITWSTNEPANGDVVYGLTNAYGSGPLTSAALTTGHGFALTGLSSATQYHFQVQSVDAAGNVMVSADNIFTTAPAPSYPVGWTELPNTMYNNVCPANYYNNEPYAFAYNCYELIGWGGAVADTLRNRMLIWGGGHNNYYGNEIYSLDLNANPVTMTRLNNPSPLYLPVGSDCSSALSDGNPNARETQNNIAYVPDLDQLFSFNGALSCENGSHLNDTWILNAANLQWQNMNPTNGPITSTTYGQYFAVTGYDPLNQTVFTQWSDGFWMYSYATNTYAMLSAAGAGHFPTYATGAVDHKRQKFFAMGPEYQSAAPQIYMIDLTGAGSWASVNITSRVTGCNPLASAQYPGLVYDSAMDRIVGWPNQGNTIYIFDPDTLTCTTQTYANGPVNTPDFNTLGTFGRFQYFPALDAFAVVNAADDNAYILRLGSGN